MLLVIVDRPCVSNVHSCSFMPILEEGLEPIQEECHLEEWSGTGTGCLGSGGGHHPWRCLRKGWM